MKKLFTFLIFSALFLSSCGGASQPDKAADSVAPDSASSVDKNAAIVGFLVESSCATAQYDGNIPDDVNEAIYEKYSIADDDALSSILKLVGADTASVKEQAVTKIKVQCNDSFVKSGVDPGAFIDSVFEQYAK